MIEGGQCHDAPALIEMAADGVHGPVVDAHTAAAVVMALVAAETAGRPVALLRRPDPDAAEAAAGTGFAVLLQTSGTTGAPKLVRHDIARLRVRLRGTGDATARWLLTYEPASFAGLQVILTALAAGATLIARPGEGVAGLVAAALEHGATHISGTPSFWRGFLMASGDRDPPLRSITLGGEAADQPLLDRLAERFPDARLRHIYASTEAGVLFAVADGRAGFPAHWLETGVDGVDLRLVGGELEVRSPRAAPGREGWQPTGDLIELAGDRALFAGRADGRVKVGGAMVSPEAVERHLLAVPGVADAEVRAVPNPLTGHILTATVVPAPGTDPDALRAALRDAAAGLEPAARPRVVALADSIPLGPAGKKRREVTA
nr:fatty acid--CoA ligase family protein [Azospirillum oleiclasticum]